MRFFYAMTMVVGAVAEEEDDAVLLQAQKILRSHSEPSSDSKQCVLSLFNNCEATDGTWNGGRCCYPSHYSCKQVMESTCDDIWTGYMCCKSGPTIATAPLTLSGLTTATAPSCQNSDGAAIMDPNMEDCTNKDFYVWREGEGTQDAQDAQVKAKPWELINLQAKKSWKSSCIAHITSTVVQTCTEWCEGNGLQCVNAMDDASKMQQQKLSARLVAEDKVVSQCSLGEQYWQDTHGCNELLNTQICACERSTMPIAVSDISPLMRASRGAYSVGQYKAKTSMGMETAPTCQNKGSPVPTRASCDEYAKSVGQDLQIAELPNYPRGCSVRKNHPSYAGVWWNTDQSGDWDQHPGFTGEVALVCISPAPVFTTAEPVFTTPEPIVTTPEPIVTTPEPITTTPEPMATTAEHVAATAEPVATTAEPSCFPVDTDSTYESLSTDEKWYKVRIIGTNSIGTYQGRLTEWPNVVWSIQPRNLRLSWPTPAEQELRGCPVSA